MWANIIEKGWAKVKGAYSNSDGGFIDNAVRSMTGAPNQWITNIPNEDVNATWELIMSADNAGFIMAAETTGGGNRGRNRCGVATYHAYSLISAF